MPLEFQVAFFLLFKITFILIKAFTIIINILNLHYKIIKPYENENYYTAVTYRIIIT